MDTVPKNTDPSTKNSDNPFTNFQVQNKTNSDIENNEEERTVSRNDWMVLNVHLAKIWERSLRNPTGKIPCNIRTRTISE